MAGGAEVAVVEAAAAAEGTAPAAAAAAAANGEEGMRMEGWLYLIRSNRFGLQYSRKRYFVLEDAALRCFKSAPSSKREVTPARLPSPVSGSRRICGSSSSSLFLRGNLVEFCDILWRDPSVFVRRRSIASDAYRDSAVLLVICSGARPELGC
jgi:hypothetical protein